MKRIKKLIFPLIVFLVVAAGVVFLTTWKDEEEPADIVKVNNYEGENKEFILENDKIVFALDSKTTQFSVTLKSTGKVWYSNPPGAGEDPLASAQERNKLNSTLLLTYSTVNGVNTLYDNYYYSMAKGIYDIEQGSDYIKVFYSVGDVEEEFIIPPVITKEKLDALMENVGSSDKMMVMEYYKKYDINNLGKNDDKESLLASYPILADEVIYVLRSGTVNNIKKKCQSIFQEAGYTYEQYLADKELDLAEKISDKPVFNVNVVYRLDGDDLLVEIPMQEIEYKEEYPLYRLSVLPYFGAAGMEEDGYLFVPEGGGALIDFNNGKKNQNSYYANVYGWDMAQSRSAVVHNTETCFNVFGMAEGDASFICILEEGAPYASIQADVSEKGNSYNYVNALYGILHREQYDIADRFTGSMFVYEDRPAEESLVQRYCFIDSGSYVDMAEAYRDYLLGKYEGYLERNDDSEAPVVVEILGAVDKVRPVFGIPVSHSLKLTTYEEAAEIMKELQGEGFGNMSVKLSGWMNGGVRQKLLGKVKTVSCLGSKKDLKALIDSAKDSGVSLYLNGITNYAYDSGITDGFFSYNDAARFVHKEQAELYKYSTVTYGQDTGSDSYYLLRPARIDEMVGNLADAASGYGVNVSFADIGRDVSSDFNMEDRVSRQAALERQSASVREVNEQGMKVMIDTGNDFVMPYSSMVSNMDLRGSEYSIIDRFIPFYQMAIHGYVDYTGESLNIAQDWEEELLKAAEYGAGLSFTLMKETAFALQDTSYTKYFGADYSAWHDRMVEIYSRYNAELGNIFSQRMAGHMQAADNVSCTVYEDGTKVYVNYGYEDVVTGDGTLVPARDYKAVQGQEDR